MILLLSLSSSASGKQSNLCSRKKGKGERAKIKEAKPVKQVLLKNKKQKDFPGHSFLKLYVPLPNNESQIQLQL